MQRGPRERNSQGSDNESSEERLSPPRKAFKASKNATARDDVNYPEVGGLPPVANQGRNNQPPPLRRSPSVLSLSSLSDSAFGFTPGVSFLNNNNNNNNNNDAPESPRLSLSRSLSDSSESSFMPMSESDSEDEQDRNRRKYGDTGPARTYYANKMSKQAGNVSATEKQRLLNNLQAQHINTAGNWTTNNNDTDRARMRPGITPDMLDSPFNAMMLRAHPDIGEEEISPEGKQHLANEFGEGKLGPAHLPHQNARSHPGYSELQREAIGAIRKDMKKTFGDRFTYANKNLEAIPGDSKESINQATFLTSQSAFRALHRVDGIEKVDDLANDNNRDLVHQQIEKSTKATFALKKLIREKQQKGTLKQDVVNALKQSPKKPE